MGEMSDTGHARAVLVERCLDAMKPELVKRAESLVTDTGIFRSPDFGKRQMSLLLSVAAAERSPEVLAAWMKGQIGKAAPSDGWRTDFGKRAINAVNEVRDIAVSAIREAGKSAANDDSIKRELWHRGVTLFFGFVRWQMLFEHERAQANRERR
jgi:hypothetical protein